jgi:isoleucyl-tRNA synthetase
MKQSKSLGNYINAQEEIAKYGADILRLWVASVNYQEDIRCNDELIGRTQDAYRKIRNTLRYLLGNIYDFDPQKHSVSYEDMSDIDKWAMQQLQQLIAAVHDNYENFIFHRVFSLLYNFCTVQMSSIYMDVLKDRLYCDAADSKVRRSSQTAMYHILDSLVRMLAPILAYTAEEAWTAMQHKSQSVESVHLTIMPQVDKSIDTTADQAKWNKIMSLRDDVLRVLEGLRQQKTIASNQQASVTITTGDDELINLIEQLGLEQFAALCIVSEVILEKTDGQTEIKATQCSHPKCQRCWNFWPSVGKNPDHSDLCQRCADVISDK